MTQFRRGKESEPINAVSSFSSIMIWPGRTSVSSRSDHIIVSSPFLRGQSAQFIQLFMNEAPPSHQYFPTLLTSA